MRAEIDRILDETRGAWRFRWSGLWVCWIVSVLGWVVLFCWPDRYQANARVFVDTRTALRPVLQGLAVEQDVNAQLNYVRQSLLGTQLLTKIAVDTQLLTPSLTDPRARVKVIDDMRERIVTTVKGASDLSNQSDAGGSVYGIAYRDASRERSIKIVDALLQRLVRDTLGGKRQGSQDAQKFLETQVQDYEQRLRAAEQRLADFKKANIDVMPTEQGGYFSKLQAEMDAVRSGESALTVATSRRDEIRRQLHGESAVTATSAAALEAGPNGSSTAGGGDVAARIRAAQATLDDLLLRFTDNHPDVIAARAELAELKHRRDTEIEALKRGDANAVADSGAGASPVYQSMQLALNQADLEIATLRRQLGDHQSRVTELRSALDTMPQVEAQYAQLNRDYDVNKTQFTALLTQLEKAKLGQEADTSGSVRFEIIEPPNAAYRPVSPPMRSVLVLGILALGLGAGGGVAYLRHKLHPVFWSINSLAAVTDATVLGAVNSAFPESHARENRLSLLLYSGAGASIFVAATAVLWANHMGLRLVLPGLGRGLL